MKSILFIPVYLWLFFMIHSCQRSSQTSIPGNMETEKELIDSLNELSWELSPTNFKKSLSLANKALIKSQNISYTSGIALSYLRIGLAYDYEGDYTEAFDNYYKSLKLWQEIGDQKQIATTYNNIGTSYYIQADYVNAMKYCLMSLKIREDLNDMKDVAQSLNNLGLIFRVQERYDEAISIYSKSIDIRTKIHDITGVMYAEQNIGVAYEKKGVPDSALYHYNFALKLAGELNDSISLASNLSNTSNIYKIVGNYSAAVKNGLRAEKILRKINDRETLSYVAESLGELYFKINNYSLAYRYTIESLELAKKLGRKELELNCYNLLAKIHSTSGDFNKAYNLKSLAASIKDSILNEESTRQLNELQTQYETSKKEQQIETLTHEKLIESQRKSIAFILATVMLLTVIVVILLFNQNKLKAQRESAILKQKMLRSQMNPHFIFNALGSVQSFIFYNKPDEAMSFLSNFSKLMRDILEGSINDFIPFEQDIAIIENYLMLEQLRYQGRFTYKINVKGEIANLQIPPMLTQPFIENAVKHGVGPMEQNGKIDIIYTINSRDIIIEIMDNGSGIKQLPDKQDHKSYAILLTRQRLNILGKGCNINVESPINTEQFGTKVTLRLPLQICKNEFYD